MGYRPLGGDTHDNTKWPRSPFRLWTGATSAVWRGGTRSCGLRVDLRSL